MGKTTKDRILDAAERLFARGGVHGTSLRMITGEADVNLAAVNYHFGSKEALTEAVVERRLVPLNRLREERLRAVAARARAEGRTPRPRDVLAAFIEPTLGLLAANDGAEHFILLVARAMTEPDDTVRRIFVRHVEPLFRLLLDALCEALPTSPPERVCLRLHFVIGAMGRSLFLAREPELLAESAARDPEALGEALIAFAAAGMEAA